jgi:nucleoid-associated protein YgaU
MSRFNNRPKAKLTRTVGDRMYENYLRKRGLKFADIYRTPILRHPTKREIPELQIVGHTWKIGDRYFKLAHKYYGDSKLWWVIAWYNRAPTESHLEIGDRISIPLPLDRILAFLRV